MKAWPILALGLCLAACGGSPSSPSPAGTVAISGSSSLSGVGVTTQFTATFTSSSGVSQDVTARASWQSSKIVVATVSSAGLATARSFGTTSIVATYQGVAGAAALSVTQGPIVGCGSITQPGSYVVAADLSGTGAGACLNLSSGVRLDCQGHAVNGEVLVVLGSDVSMTNCNINAAVALYISSSQNVTVTKSTMSSPVTVSGSSFVTLSTNVVRANNTGVSGGGIVFQDGGNHNQVLQNTIDGGWDGSSYGTQGADDGILVLSGESDDVIQGNTIRNVWDAGVETLGAVTNTTISDNVITSVGVTGIGAYYRTAWQGNTVSGNKVSRTPFMLAITYLTSLGPVIPGSFQNNTISSNVFRNAVSLPSGYCVDCGVPHSMDINLTGMQAGIGGNLIQGNDFGTQSAGPMVIPLSAFTDGGGNVCASGGNLPCSATGPTPSSRLVVTPDMLLQLLRLRRSPPRPATQMPFRR